MRGMSRVIKLTCKMSRFRPQKVTGRAQIASAMKFGRLHMSQGLVRRREYRRRDREMS